MFRGGALSAHSWALDCDHCSHHQAICNTLNAIEVFKEMTIYEVEELNAGQKFLMSTMVEAVRGSGCLAGNLPDHELQNTILDRLSKS